jgi:hypothetical protein
MPADTADAGWQSEASAASAAVTDQQPPGPTGLDHAQHVLLERLQR